MGKNKDLFKIIMLILCGMLFPFIGSLSIIYGIEPVRLGSAFIVFLVLFGIELVVVFFYFYVGSRRAEKHIQQLNPLKKDD